MSAKRYKATQMVTLLQDIEVNVAKGETGAFQSKSDTGRDDLIHGSSLGSPLTARCKDLVRHMRFPP